MRLWSLHPSYLDPKGIVAAWREALLAQKVLAGATRGYTNHSQLQRFKETPHPQQALSAFLRPIVVDATRRGYSFDREKILPGPLTAAELGVAEPGPDLERLRERHGEPALRPADLPHTETDPAAAVPPIPVATEQIRYEAELLVFKLRVRAPRLVDVLEDDLRADRVALHPLFAEVPGPIASWEKVRNEI